MELVDYLQECVDTLSNSQSEELSVVVLSALAHHGDHATSLEDTFSKVRILIELQSRRILSSTAAWDNLESIQSELIQRTLADSEAMKSRAKKTFRELVRLSTRASDAVDRLSAGLPTIVANVRNSILEREPGREDLVAELASLQTAVADWVVSYGNLKQRIRGQEFLFAAKYDSEEIERAAKLDAIKTLGINPYPHRFDRTHTISGIVAEYAAQGGEELEAQQPRVTVAGRIHAINKMGKASFVRFTDGRELLQIYIKSNEVDELTWALLKLLNLGDLIGTEGRLFRTRTGELSIHAESLTFLAKALVPPPDKYYGLHDIELRHRQRYADLIANRDVRRVFETRSEIIRSIRRYFDERGYVEVETPMLTPLPTGAAARPFATHHNALDIDLYARIAPELYLKRLIVGGFEKVYEINRNFRNEGIDRSHNPEFTMLEWYEAYSEYEDLLKLTEELISDLVEQICGKAVIEYGENQIDFTRPWKRLTMREAVAHYWPDTGARPAIEDLSSPNGILRWAEELPDLRSQISHLKLLDYGHLLGAVFEHVAEEKLISPTFITEFPTELSPLSKQNQDDPGFVDRFELFIAGMEIANAFCEINDPVDQRRRFEAQMKLRERGDEEAMVIDEDYIRALSYGMPPTAGEGVGIDRLVMILTNQHSIRDVILFPHMRPESK